MARRPTATTLAPMPPPCERLQWVRVRGMQVFWPAVVYKSLSEAVAHAHDPQPLRSIKPALDAEDNIVFFFGVTHRHTSLHDGIVPSFRLGIVRDDELTEFPWEGADDFAKVCRTHNIFDDIITRAENHHVFQRACDHATRFEQEATSDREACRVIMSLLRESATSPQKKAAPTKPTTPPPTTNKPTANAPTKPTVAAPTKPTPTPTVTTKITPTLAQACWRHMESAGWTTLVQANGTTLYAMPGISFFEFKPNVNMFDALDNACAKFLQTWASQPDANSANVGDVGELVWDLMLADGWQTVVSATETWYTMPNTTFDKFIPNVTIFQSKKLAIAKFLASVGMGEPTADANANVGDAHSASADENEHTEASENENSELESTQSEDVEMSEPDLAIFDMDSSSEEEEEEEEEEEHVPAKANKRANAAKKPTIEEKETSARRRSRKQRRRSLQQISKPTFRFTEGKIEQELRVRGWYWKPVSTKIASDGYMYYKPHCYGKDTSELQENEDYFAGRVQLNEYLRMSGLELEIKDKLEREHNDQWDKSIAKARASVSRVVAPPQPVKRQPTPTAPPKRSARVITISDDEDSDNDDEPLAGSLAKPAAHRRKLAPAPIKRVLYERKELSFGVVEKKLKARGWRFLPGRFEYDYIMPNKDRKTGVAGKDYFMTQVELIEYLKSSGLWDEIEREVDREREQVFQTPQKRKLLLVETTASDDNTRTPVSKKPKSDEPVDPEFSTPPNKRKPELQEMEIEPTQESTNQKTLISPESDTTKSKPTSEPKESSTPALARSLHSAFTPSPQNDKKVPEVTHSARQLAETALTRLTLNFTPQNFAHREEESSLIQEFCRTRFTDRRGGSLYLSGSPGCGKSALLRSLTDTIGQLHEKLSGGASTIVPVHINAMGLHDFGQLFCQLATTLTKREFTDKDDAFEAIERATDSSTSKRFKTLLLVLDEIDALGKRASLEPDLCRLFELAHRADHAFILVGIANQIDFTERHLASLRQQLPHVKPQVVVFKPYSFQTISDILTDRLGGAPHAATIMNVNGVAFIARKVAAQSGDVRLALDICRRVLQQKLSSSTDHDVWTPVPLTEIVKTIKVVMDAKSKTNVGSLPRNLQMILFASTRLVALQVAATMSSEDQTTNNNTSTSTLYDVDDLYACYVDVSHDAGVFKPLSRSEFRVGLDTLSSEGIADLKKHLVKLHCTPSELLQAFKHDAYFARLI